MNKKIFYFSLLFFILFALIIYIFIDTEKYNYNQYSFIDNSRRNLFNFKYPKDWHVQMMEYWEATETREANPLQGVYIYMNENDFKNYIEITKTHSQAPFSSSTMGYDSSKEYVITKYDKIKAKVYHKNNVDMMDIYVTFESEKEVFNNQVGVHVKVNKDFYAKNKYKIWKTIKSVQINK